jgi:hypothetical protein
MQPSPHQPSSTPRAAAPDPAAAAAAWSRHLSLLLDNPVRVTFGRARRQVIQSRGSWNHPAGAPIELRLSGFFAQAPVEVRDAVGAWLKSGKRARRASALLDAFIAEQLAAQPAPPRRAATLEPAGSTHDLTQLAAEVLAPGGGLDREELAPLGLPDLTWGKRGPSRARRSLQLGSYEEDRHLVRVHRVLDQPAVPASVVRFVVFHELLHAARAAEARRSPAPPGGPRRHLHHDAAFRRREAAYPGFAAAEAWQRAHISALLRSARSGRPLARSRARRLVEGVLEQLKLEF